MTPTAIAAAQAGSHDVGQLDDHLRIPLQRMIRDCPSSTWLTSGYRPPEYQAVLFADAVAKYGSEQAARRWVAPPGGSNHQRRQAADLGWSDLAGKTWAHANCARYGLLFPMSWEDWHIEAADKTGAVAADPNPRPPAPPAAQEDIVASLKDLQTAVDGAARTIMGQDDAHGGDADPAHISLRDVYRLLADLSGRVDALATQVQDNDRVMLRGVKADGTPSGHPYNMLAIAGSTGVPGLPPQTPPVAK